MIKLGVKLMSNTVVNLNKVRAANDSKNPESSVLIFDYHAPSTDAGQTEQRPLVRIKHNSLRRLKDGDWTFQGTNLYRVSDRDKGIRSYRLSRINGIVRRPF